MSPKEKAEELVNKFTRPIDDDYFNNYNPFGKECAILSVEEILEALPPFELALECVAKIEFWNNVKQEIEKL